MSKALLAQVIAIAARQSGIRHITPGMALDQDLRISGDEVTELVEALAGAVRTRCLELALAALRQVSEPHLFTGFRFFWRLLTWPVRGYVFDSSPFERLEMRHIAVCIEAGHWIEP